MLSQRTEEIRSEAMLQNYSDAFPDLSYSHLNMPPAADYGMVTGSDQPWYNTYIHQGGMQNGGEMFGRENKAPPDWSSYHSDHDQPYMPQQINNNNSEGQYPGMQPVSQMMRQQMQMDGGPMMMSSHDQMAGTSSQDPLMINEVHNDIMTNGVDNTHVENNTVSIKEEETLPRLDGPQATMVSSDNHSGEGNKDMLKLPGFHQTFGNITEIGRFSQHDDYFESPPNEVDPPKVSEPIEPTPKRKPRGRKRKQPETREMYPRQSYIPEAMHSQQYAAQEPYQQWQYPRHQHYCQSEQYHHWRPHPYYNNHHHHHHHYPQNMYPQQYNEYMHYNYSPYQGNWPVSRDYMVHNYPGYV